MSGEAAHVSPAASTFGSRYSRELHREHAAGELAGQVRTLNGQLQRDFSATLPANHPIYARLVNYAGFLISRFQIGVDGKTP